MSRIPRYTPSRLIGSVAARYSVKCGSRMTLGVDVGAGGDQPVICLRRGARARIVERGRTPDTGNRRERAPGAGPGRPPRIRSRQARVLVEERP